MICKKRLLNSYLLYWHFLWMSLWKKKKKSLTLCFPKGGCIFSPLCSLPIFEKPTFPYQIKCPVPNTGHNITHSFPTGWNSSLSKLLPAALQSLNQGTTLPSRKHTGFFFFFLLSHVRLSVTPWAIAYQAPPSMEFSRQEYWSGVPFPSPGDLPDPGIEAGCPASQADALPSELTEKPLQT